MKLLWGVLASLGYIIREKSDQAQAGAEEKRKLREAEKLKKQEEKQKKLEEKLKREKEILGDAETEAE